ncbi:MAG: prenyltransferase/squalene oxidase repeat-containing protein, partial [Verrucomicrobiota bacterium]
MSSTVSKDRLAAALERATRSLTAELQDAPHWCGELSSSALSTATAVIALSALPPEQAEPEDLARIRGGLAWLVSWQNPDGGWGDTERSHSNISTTALTWAAFGAAGADAEFPQVLASCTQWLQTASGAKGNGWEQALAEAIRKRYGKDRTFSVPILTACILSGRLGTKGWREVPALPFELAALPHSFYGAMQLPVVSYALPALIAIGRAIHRHAPVRNPLVRGLRNALRDFTGAKLETLQPENGGFLEATPLTSFVLMSLAACGEAHHRTGLRAAQFLRASVRADGSWPIDTNLSTWTSTWAINALSQHGLPLHDHQRQALRQWLIGQQGRRIHPYTNAAPGGWAWTDLPGGVPDADDTAGALLALLALAPSA